MTPASAFYFGPAGAERFGWLHGEGSPGRVGVVLCNALGRDENSVHASLRHLASALAEAGLPSLRFDPLGEGDSAPLPAGADAAAQWQLDVDLAIDALRSRTGVTGVCVVAVRAAVLAGACAAEARDDVVGFAAIAPAVSGRSLLREWKALAAASAVEAQPEDGALHAGGYRFDPATCATLGRIDLATRSRPAAPRVFIAERADLPLAGRWSQRLQEQGADVVVQPVADLSAMFLDPHHAQVPQGLCGPLLAWIASLSPPQSAPAAHAVTCHDDLTGPGGEWRETPVRIGTPELFGVLTQPRAAGRREAVLMLNAGAVRRVGPHGWYVPLARRLASGGLTVLRIDLGGLGDSAPRPSSRHRPVYPTEAVDDVRLAVEWLRREQGVEQVHLLGLCSGAYHAFKAAVAGVPLASALMLNPLTFFWREGLSLDPELAEHRVALQAADYGRAVWKAERWLKLLRGQVDLRLLSRVMARRVANLLRHRARAAGRLLGWPLKDDLAGELHLADRHGVALQFVFSPQDPGLVLLREQGGPAVSRLARRGRLGLQVLEEGDHTFSAVGSRGALFAHLAQVLRA